jgi:hypothetical protein
MPVRPQPLLAALLLIPPLLGCGSDADAGGPAAAGTLEGSLTVVAAASLTHAIAAIEAAI